MEVSSSPYRPFVYQSPASRADHDETRCESETSPGMRPGVTLDTAETTAGLPRLFLWLPDFARELAIQYSPRQALLALAQHYAIGGRDSRPTLPLLPVEVPEVNEAIEVMLERGVVYRGEATARDKTYRFFPASVVSYSSHLANFARTDWQPASQLFCLHLSDDEHDEVLAAITPGPDPIVPEAFGYLRYTVRPDGQIGVLEVHNDLFDRLTSVALRERYRDWAEELLDTFIQFIERCACPYPAAAEPGRDAFLAFMEQEFRTILIPPPPVMIERCHAQMSPTAPSAIAEGQRMRGRELAVDPALIVERYGQVPVRFGFTLHSLEGDTANQDEELGVFHEGLVLTVSSPIGERTPFGSPFLGVLMEDYRELGSGGRRFVVHHRPTVPRERPNHDSLSHAFEVTPSRDLLSLADFFPREVIEILNRHERHVSDHRRLVDAVVSERFTLNSRGFAGGMPHDWAVIPESSLPPGHYLFSVQSPLQNRHPSLRIVEVTETGERRSCIIGIKGGGVAEVGDWPVHEPITKAQAPIYRSDKPSGLVSTHQYWGGMPLIAAVSEACYSTALLDHVTEFQPRLVERIPIPLRVSVPAMLPLWKEDKTQWLFPDEYAAIALCEPRRRVEFATLFTTLASDVRVNTLVDRVFNGVPAHNGNLYWRLGDITNVMRFLYHEHGYELRELSEDYIPPGCTLTAPAICEYLRRLGEKNEATARTIYERVCRDPLAIINSVHKRGGHLGGGTLRIEGASRVGAVNGGVPTMRNTDIRGGFHDIDSCCFFPWASVAGETSERSSLNERYLNMMQAFDLLYWAETEHWMRLVLFGAPYDEAGVVERCEVFPEHDLTMYTKAPSTARIVKAALHLGAKDGADQIQRALAIECG